MKDSILHLYHGSKDIIEHPMFGYGCRNNDYGLGFYCTESLDMAKEWSCTDEHGGYANHYSFDIRDLDVLDLCSGRYNTLNWLAILVKNRTFDSSARIRKAREFLLSEYLPEYESYDVIRGYRADDAYFAFVRMFLDNSLSMESLEKSMRLGKLGEQIVIRSRGSFGRLEFISAEKSDWNECLRRRTKRTEEARKDFGYVCESDPEDGTFLMDLIRRG